jgi:hypothetical protein
VFLCEVDIAYMPACVFAYVCTHAFVCIVVYAQDMMCVNASHCSNFGNPQLFWFHQFSHISRMCHCPRTCVWYMCVVCVCVCSKKWWCSLRDFTDRLNGMTSGQFAEELQVS